MSVLQHLVAIIAAVATFAIVLEMLRRRRLRERHAGWWIIAGAIAIVVSIFPQVLATVSAALGFEVPINLIFFMSLFTLFLVALQHSAELTRVEERNRILAERLTLLELQVESLGSRDNSQTKD